MDFSIRLMKQEERANLRQEILDAAWELFDKNGYENYNRKNRIYEIKWKTIYNHIYVSIWNI